MARLERRLDTYVNRMDDVLKRRLVDFVDRSDGAGDVGRTAVRHGDGLASTPRLQPQSDNIARQQVDNILPHADEGITLARQADVNPRYADNVDDPSHSDNIGETRSTWTNPLKSMRERIKITHRLDNHVTKGRPVNAINRIKEDIVKGLWSSKLWQTAWIWGHPNTRLVPISKSGLVYRVFDGDWK